MYIKFTAVFLVVVILTGCDLQNLRPTNNDLSEFIEVEKRANIAYQKEDWATAEKEYLQLTQQVPAQSEPWFRLGNVYARTNRLDAAVSTYKEALKRDPGNSKIWHNLGIVQLRQATSTFIQVVNLTEEDDPLNSRGKQVVNSVTELLSSGFE